MPTNADSNYADRIRQRRESLGLSQAELAKRSGLSLATIWRVEKKQRGLSHQAARRIEEILGLLAPMPTTGAPPPVAIDDSGVTPQERTLLATFRSLLDEEKEQLLGRAMTIYSEAAAKGRVRRLHLRVAETTDPGDVTPPPTRTK